MFLGSLALGLLLLVPLPLMSTGSAPQSADSLVLFANSFLGQVVFAAFSLCCAWIGVLIAKWRGLVTYDTNAIGVACVSTLMYWILDDSTHLIFIIAAPLSTIVMLLVQYGVFVFAITFMIRSLQNR